MLPEISSPSSLTILLVEDDQAVRETLLEYLADQGHDVTAVVAADDAMVLIEKGEDFDLCLTDVETGSGSDGIQLVNHIARHWPATDIIVMSGDHRNRDRLLPIPVRFLVKPFRLADLRAVLDTLEEDRRVARSR